MVIKIYSDKKYLPSNFTNHMLIPFFGQQKEQGDPDADRFDNYIAEARNIFEMVNLKDANVAVYPASPTHEPERFKEFQGLTASKPLLVFFNDDSDVVLNYRENTYIFRTSFYKSSQRPFEFGLPAWSVDHGAFEPREWKPTPTISFCGQIYPLDVRNASLKILENSTKVKSNFIIRNQFWGGWLSSGRQGWLGSKLRSEFIQNMAHGDYVLCARGGGNFSYRIYETIMSGRIPLFINTDCVLPFDFLVNWGGLFPIVNKEDINNIDSILLDFHNSLTPEQFIERQKYLRHMWTEWLSPTGFFKNIHKHWEK